MRKVWWIGLALLIGCSAKPQPDVIGQITSATKIGCAVIQGDNARQQTSLIVTDLKRLIDSGEDDELRARIESPINVASMGLYWTIAWEVIHTFSAVYTTQEWYDNTLAMYKASVIGCYEGLQLTTIT